MSLNFFRNAFYQVQNNLKKHYHELVHNELEKLDTPISKFTTHYKLYYKNPSCDGPNVVPMIEKFFLDAVQELNIISNDNVRCCVGGSWEVAGQDKNDPRVEITLTPVKETNEKTTNRDP